MRNGLMNSEIELGNFGEYLLKSRVVLEKHAPHYVRWVRRFLSEVPPRAGLSLEDRIGVFLDNLRPQAPDWQVDQAEKAIYTHVVKDLRNPATSPLDLMQKAG